MPEVISRKTNHEMLRTKDGVINSFLEPESYQLRLNPILVNKNKLILNLTPKKFIVGTNNFEVSLPIKFEKKTKDVFSRIHYDLKRNVPNLEFLKSIIQARNTLHGTDVTAESIIKKKKHLLVKEINNLIKNYHKTHGL